MASIFEQPFNDLSLPACSVMQDVTGGRAATIYTLRVSRGRWIERFSLTGATTLNEALTSARELGYLPTHLVVVGAANWSVAPLSNGL